MLTPSDGSAPSLLLTAHGDEAARLGNHDEWWRRCTNMVIGVNSVLIQGLK